MYPGGKQSRGKGQRSNDEGNSLKIYSIICIGAHSELKGRDVKISSYMNNCHKGGREILIHRRRKRKYKSKKKLSLENMYTSHAFAGLCRTSSTFYTNLCGGGAPP